ncbi:MAG: phenylacetate-CoA oxygenase subunit PaaC [Flavobacteriales bacterium]|nr:phenylacetate-CoA oxygenase subunit PaaC [Flavobacteriales bacterium]
MNNNENLYQFLLRCADDNLIAGQRMAEWCSNGPILEEDLAMVNISLDFLGQSESFMEYAASLDTTGKTSDDLAFGRSEREYYNHLLVEQPNDDFAVSMVKLLFFSAFQKELYTALMEGKDERIAAISAKAVKEARYHYRHASDWFERLALGTDESLRRLTYAVEELWPFTENLFETDEVYNSLFAEQIVPDMKSIREKWMTTMREVFSNGGVDIPANVHMYAGGINGYHTEHLGHLLCEMQYLHHAHPGAQW